MMSRHLQTEIEKLKRNVLYLSAIVENSVQKAVRAIESRDPAVGGEVLEADEEIDRMEVEIEEECLKVLALHQPVAGDLRFIIAILKMNNELERIGDQAVNIAERAVLLACRPKVDMPFDFALMAEKAKDMLKQSLDALVNRDSKLARKVCAADDAVDDMHKQMYIKAQDGIRHHPEHAESYIFLLSVSAQLERIADHATNVAEDVIYMVEGDIIRHRDAPNKQNRHPKYYDSTQ